MSGNAYVPGNLSARDRELLAPLVEPAPMGARFGVNRHLFDLYQGDPNLRARFPDLDQDGDAFVEWVHAHGQEQYSIIDELMPPKPRTFRHFDPRTPIVGRVLPPDAGVNVLSFLRAEVGTGEAGRLLIAALDQRRIPVLPMESPIRPGCRHGHSFETVPPDGIAFPITITCANPDWMGIWAHNHGERVFRERYSIGYWWWEVDGPTPFTWRPSFRLVDEVWTASEHIADTLRPALAVPLRTMPFPVSVPEGAQMSRSMLGLPDGFLFLTMFDYASTLQRKNPLAVIEAFRRNFTPGEGAKLVVKCVNESMRPDEHRRLLDLAADHPDVHVVDRYISSEEKNAMLGQCDCFVSLHRAEGFGLPLAEAMYLAKPTIATAYSGNLEFQNEQNSHLVRFHLVEIGPDAKQYPPNGVWAEPDVAHAAALMRHVFEDPVASRALGTRAAADIRRTHSLEAAGIAMERRLEVLMRELGIADDEGSGSSARGSEARAVIARGPVSPRRSRLGPAGPAVRRVVLRVLRPFTAYQREVDEHLVGELERLGPLIDGLQGVASRAELRLAAARAAELALSRSPAVPGHEWIASRVDRLERMIAPVYPLVPLERFETIVGSVEGYRQPLSGPPPDNPYFEFERLFRGSERVVRDRQRGYLEIVGRRAPVVDIGCGRGEFLELVRGAGLEAIGVDLDPVIVERCRDKGLDVTEGDGVEYLQELPESSLGVVFGAQVIEHLPYERLLTLLRAARAKLRPGGVLVLETVNPHTPLAMRNFWVDPTHEHPLFPEVVLTLCRLTGFARGYIWYPAGDGDPAQERGRQLDYAVVAEVAGPDGLEPPVPGAVSLATDVGELWYPGHCEVLTPAVQHAGRWDPVDAAALRWALKPGMTVLDVGAHVGYFALAAASCVGPSGRVLAVEPSPENYALLSANVERAGANQVVPVHAAAWRESGELELRLSETNTGDHRVYNVDENRTAVRVPALALDEQLAEEERLDFVLLDTQGSERAVLEGMLSALRRWRPRIQVEFWPEGIREFGDDPASMARFYTDLGYKIAVLGDDGSVQPLEQGGRLVQRAEACPGSFCTLLLTPQPAEVETAISGDEIRGVRERVAEIPFWWHSIELADGVVTPGQKTPEVHAQELAMLHFPNDLTGKSVLDIGGWDGFYALEAEVRGAERVAVLDHFVWSIDFGALTAWQNTHPGQQGPDTIEESEFWRPDTLPGKAGFDLARRLRGSRVGELVGDFMTVPLKDVGVWDVVLFLGILYHLKDPLRGLRRLAAMTREMAIIESHAVSVGGHPDASLWTFYPTRELNDDPTNWFAPTTRALEGAVRAAGFSRVELLTVPPPAAEGTIVNYRAGLHAFK